MRHQQSMPGNRLSQKFSKATQPDSLDIGSSENKRARVRRAFEIFICKPEWKPLNIVPLAQLGMVPSVVSNSRTGTRIQY